MNTSLKLDFELQFDWSVVWLKVWISINYQLIAQQSSGSKWVFGSRIVEILNIPYEGSAFIYNTSSSVGVWSS